MPQNDQFKRKPIWHQKQTETLQQHPIPQRSFLQRIHAIYLEPEEKSTTSIYKYLQESELYWCSIHSFIQSSSFNLFVIMSTLTQWNITIPRFTESTKTVLSFFFLEHTMVGGACRYSSSYSDSLAQCYQVAATSDAWGTTRCQRSKQRLQHAKHAHKSLERSPQPKNIDYLIYFAIG